MASEESRASVCQPDIELNLSRSEGVLTTPGGCLGRERGAPRPHRRGLIAFHWQHGPIVPAWPQTAARAQWPVQAPAPAPSRRCPSNDEVVH